jgi:DNA-binding Lrp family transcriptional regulator
MRPTLDRTDVEILVLLQNNARLTHKEIAHAIHKTITPVYERIKRLEREGYIKGYRTLVDRNKIGQSLVALTNVQLKEHTQEMLGSFETAIVQFPEVMECYNMTGVYDYLLKIVVPDMNGYQYFVMNKLARLPNIHQVQSSFIMTEIKNETAFHTDILQKISEKK